MANSLGSRPPPISMFTFCAADGRPNRLDRRCRRKETPEESLLLQSGGDQPTHPARTAAEAVD